VKPKYLDRNR